MRRAMTGALLLLLAGGAVAQERQVWTATCTKGGRTVYRERIADRPTQAKELDVARRNPGAVCLVLAPEEAGGLPDDIASALQQSRPGATLGPVLSFASPTNPPADAGIDAALRALKGNGIPVALKPVDQQVQREPERIGVELSSETSSETPRPARSDWVRIALYKDASEEDAISDWTRIAAAAPTLAAYTPSLSPAGGGILMLSLGPVPAREAAGLCLAAEGAGLDCISGTGTASRTEDGPALRSLALSYPGHVAWGAPEESCSRYDPDTSADEGPSSRRYGLRTSMQWLDLTSLGTGAEPRAAQRGPKAGATSSSAALASSLDTSFSTKPKVRPASAFMR